MHQSIALALVVLALAACTIEAGQGDSKFVYGGHGHHHHHHHDDSSDSDSGSNSNSDSFSFSVSKSDSESDSDEHHHHHGHHNHHNHHHDSNSNSSESSESHSNSHSHSHSDSSSSESNSDEFHPVCKKPCISAGLVLEKTASENTNALRPTNAAGWPEVAGHCPCKSKKKHHKSWYNETFYLPEINVGVGTQGFTFDCFDKFCACDSDGNCYKVSADVVTAIGVYPFCGATGCGTYISVKCNDASNAEANKGLLFKNGTVAIPCSAQASSNIGWANAIYRPVDKVSCNNCFPLKHLHCHGPFKKAHKESGEDDD